MSAGGRLSMTNQPRSSNVAAAVERPAPDIPTRIRYSAIGSIFPSARRVAAQSEAATTAGSRTRARDRSVVALSSHLRGAWPLKAKQQQPRDRGLELEIDRALEKR